MRAPFFAPLAGLLLAFAVAVPEEPAPVPLPETPVGRMFSELNECFASGEHRPFIETHFTQQFLKSVPMANHLNIFKQVKVRHGSFLVREIEESSEFHLSVTAQGAKSKAWRRVVLKVTPDEPHRIQALDIGYAAEPEGS